MAKVTIQSIANDLGLSRNTVSMALKGNDLVAQRTRETVSYTHLTLPTTP